MTQSADDVLDLIDMFEREYGSTFTDIYSHDQALGDFAAFDYGYVLATAVSVADEIMDEEPREDEL